MHSAGVWRIYPYPYRYMVYKVEIRMMMHSQNQIEHFPFINLTVCTPVKRTNKYDIHSA